MYKIYEFIKNRDMLKNKLLKSNNVFFGKKKKLSNII